MLNDMCVVYCICTDVCVQAHSGQHSVNICACTHTCKAVLEAADHKTIVWAFITKK